MSDEKIVFHGGVQVASFEGRDWVPEADYATLGEALTRMNEKAAKLERELTRYRDPAMVLVNRADLESVAKDLQELVCALFNRIRSERAFDKFSGIAGRAHDKTRAMIAAVGKPQKAIGQIFDRDLDYEISNAAGEGK